MNKDELKRNSHPHITDSGEWIETIMEILKDIKSEKKSLENKFGKPRSKYHRQFEVDNLYFKIMKIGDTIRFNFAGSTDEGQIIEILKDGNKIIEYIVWDGKYRYHVDKEQII